MSIETGVSNHWPSPEDDREGLREWYVGPSDEIEATAELIAKIPEGEWSIPEEYASEHIDKVWRFKNLSWTERVDQVLSPWVVFINHATETEKFLRKSYESMEKGEGMIVNGDTLGLERLDDYRSVTSNRVSDEQVLDHLKSLRRGFITLLSKPARKELGVKRLPKVKPEDMENVRHFVNMFNRKYGGLPLGCSRFITPLE